MTGIRWILRGRYWDRTSDLFRVKEARYPCANRPKVLATLSSGLEEAYTVSRGACTRSGVTYVLLATERSGRPSPPPAHHAGSPASHTLLSSHRDTPAAQPEPRRPGANFDHGTQERTSCRPRGLGPCTGLRSRRRQDLRRPTPRSSSSRATVDPLSRRPAGHIGRAPATGRAPDPRRCVREHPDPCGDLGHCGASAFAPPVGGAYRVPPSAQPMCGRSSVGRASPCQGEGRRFESGRPLHPLPRVLGRTGRLAQR